MAEKQSPFFDKAPVVERVLGVQFVPIVKFTNGHLGAFWQTLDVTEWPHVSDAPPVPQQFENFPFGQGVPHLAMFAVNVGFPGARLMIRNRAGDRIIQIQNGVFNYNWIGQGEGKSYPRYEKLQSEFFEVLERFRGFIGGIGDWNPNQWEATYLNHIPKGTVWHSPEDWGAAFESYVSLPYRLPGSKLETFGGQWRYEIEPQRGRLYVDIQHAHKVDGNKTDEIIALRLTARGPIVPDKPGWNLADGLASGHRVIVDGFSKLASANAREFWKER